MAENDSPTPEPTPEASKAQAEFARYKDRVATGTGAPFASKLPTSAVPAWSLQRAPTAPAHVAPGPPPPSADAPSGGGYSAIVGGLGTTIRLGVEALNAALSSSISMMDGVTRPTGWGDDACGCDACTGSCGPSACDCCSVMACGSGCCEPSVGTCC